MTDAGGQSRSPTAPEVLRQAIEGYYLSDLHTMLPGRVEEYDSSKQEASVKPLIQRLVLTEDGEQILEEIPIISNVPVAFPRVSSFFLSFPIKKGDLVMLHFAERSLDNWLGGQGEDTDPDEFRMHDLTDAVAYSGLYPFNRAIKDVDEVNMVLGADEGGLQIHITPDGVMEIKVDGAADEAVALGNKLKTFWDSTVKPAYDSHIHPTGVGPSGPPAAPLPPFDSSIISTILLLKDG
jgi:hypothetical protein